MKRKLLVICICIMIGGTLVSCSESMDVDYDNKGIVQDKINEDENVDNKNINNENTDLNIGNEDKSLVGDIGDSHAMQDNMLPLSTEVSYDGISYKVLEYSMTKEFGSRKLENLNDLSFEGIDENGNLLGNEVYIFAKIIFTNNTEGNREIFRNGGMITSITEDNQIFQASADAVYIDEKWEQGGKTETYHYILEPGESVESEIGYIVVESDILGDLYYMVGDTSQLDDIDNKFLKLE